MPLSKRGFVASRLQRRLRHLKIFSFGSYVYLLRGSGLASIDERSKFISALTTNVTGVFREPHHFLLLHDQILSRKNRAKSFSSPCCVWSAGCSTGEEPLSIAAVCYSEFGSRWTHIFKILATDIDEEVLRAARSRCDPENIGARLLDGAPQTPFVKRAKQRCPRYFYEELNLGITFQRHNLLHFLPGWKCFDAIFCRNVTIYFEREVQKAAQKRLVSRLGPDGLFLIGHSERLAFEAKSLAPVGRTAFRQTSVTKGPKKK
ncbi:Chemotaxis protein methyltransferase [Jannaschia seosinensis]|uniref:protein-glutamate O-methyltransferase n=2 Tax=Jannaschia seosinensis TaxID=313367 RepID=A0A0M7BFG5_9RHOB|nr:Chemotaxis protein methyltransferase [Jannaschia seosinensis]